MLRRGFGRKLGASIAVILFLQGLGSAQAQTTGAALSGLVSSLDGEPMEGVLVSAKRAGAIITTTVVTDPQGRYEFPSARLEPGKYTMRIRAVGYALENPAAVEIQPQKSTSVDLKLRKASTDEMATQLTNSEWLMSIPGTEAQKASIRGCNHCHTYERIMRTQYDVEALMGVLQRMSQHAPSSFPLMLQPNPLKRMGGGPMTPERQAQLQQARQQQAQYLSSINLNKGPTWSYPFKTLPRPSGKATRVIYTEYDLPARTRQPHDVIVDSQGLVWYASFGEQILGRLNPKTLQIKEWAIPVNKPTRNKGVLDLQFDEDENLWMGNGLQNAIQKFDRKTEKFVTFPLAKEFDADHVELLFMNPKNHKVDGKVWVNNNGEWTLLRVDIASGKWERFEPFTFPRPNIYQVLSDSKNNGWFTVFGREHIGRIDAKTGEIKLFETPMKDTAPRRGMIDKQDRLWVALNKTDHVAMFDPKTEKFQTWSLGIPQYYAYDVWSDKNGEAWASTEYADRVVRLNPKTGEITPYLLPNETNMRRSYGDNSSKVVNFWVGATHTASIIRLEPLE
ncbi:MAG: carboxypeptidase regulatory-like domain-containing protein [Betaproteobacteria bacterium]